MGTALIPGTTTRIRVPDGATPEVVQRMVRSYQHFQATNAAPDAVPQVPVTADELDPAGSAGIDYRPEDHESWPRYIANEVGSFVRGAGRSLAGTPDLLMNAWEKGVVDPWVRLPQGKPVSPSVTEPGGYRQPVLEKFEEVAPAMPLGHQGAQDYGEIYGVPSITNLGKNIVKSTIKKGVGGAIKSLPADVTKAAIRTVPEVLGDQGGGYIGGETAKALGGDSYEMAGNLLGSVFAGAVQPTIGKTAAKKTFSGPQTDETFRTVDRLNAELERGGKPTIPMSLGLGGNKYGGLIEDYLARAPFAGSPSLKARRDQYAGIEGAVQQAAEDVRGGPPTGQITERTMGIKADTMANKAEAAITDEISRIQEELMNEVGADFPMRATEAEATLRGIIDAPSGVSQRSKDHAQAVLSDLQKEYPTQPKKGEIGPPAPESSYGAIKEWRQDFGKEIRPGDRPLKSGVKKRAYGGVTEDMRQVAEDQGVKDFDEIQAETERLARQRDVVGTHQNKAGETQAFSAMMGGKRGKNLEQFGPYKEHTSDELSDLFADAIEQRYRGASAGQDIAPENFPIAKLPDWLTNDPAYREYLTRGHINANQTLDDAAFLAQRDIGRSGEFSKPGGSKAAGTAATSIPGVVSAGSAIGTGASALLGHGVSPWALAAPPVSAIANYLLSKAASSDEISRNILKPKPRSIPGIMGDAVKGAAVAAGGESSDRAEKERKRKQREEMEREEKRNRR